MTPARPLLQPDDEPNSPEVEAAYAAVPAGMKAELLEGVFYMMNRPKMPHVLSASRLGVVLGASFDAIIGSLGGWVIVDEPELPLGRRPDKLGPDLAGWRRARMPKVPETAAISLAPDWVCEVLSESTEDRDLGVKKRIYRRERVAHYWLVDPRAQTLTVLRLDGGRWVTIAEHSGEARVRVEPFEQVEIDLGVLWRT